MTSILATLMVGALASCLLTALTIRYALSRQMVDHPGARRSHGTPTPRGGGIAPVLVILVGGALLAKQDAVAKPELLACLSGFAAVAAIGWADDHRPLPAHLRLVVHVFSAVAAGVALCGMPHSWTQIALIAIAVFAITSLVNIWNFMDGIDAIATSQSALLSLLLVTAGVFDCTWTAFATLSCAAAVGFLPFNISPARVFLGDVGSGALGYLSAILLLHAVVVGAIRWPLALLLVSAFLIDAGMTLLTRILRGRKWWRPHREHVYQWLVRCGCTHSRVALFYAAWTLAMGAIASALARQPQSVALAVSSAVLVSGSLSWLGIRERLWLLLRHRR